MEFRCGLSCRGVRRQRERTAGSVAPTRRLNELLVELVPQSRARPTADASVRPEISEALGGDLADPHYSFGS